MPQVAAAAGRALCGYGQMVSVGWLDLLPCGGRRRIGRVAAPAAGRAVRGYGQLAPVVAAPGGPASRRVAQVGGLGHDAVSRN